MGNGSSAPLSPDPVASSDKENCNLGAFDKLRKHIYDGINRATSALSGNPDCQDGSNDGYDPEHSHRKRRRRKPKNIVEHVVSEDPLHQSGAQGVPDNRIYDSDGDVADEFYTVDPVDNKCRRKFPLPIT
uniref:Uncharacterized protein n=1 Tax=Spongospora subterranea TaxID=70186 RepID=A0A0H5R8M0_9EUKA|eukprot:CRZ10465.1 hypothetical protein [Spongospora subterranea]